MSKSDGGDAFPSPGVILHKSTDRGLREFQQGAYPGMSLRDYFAAAALPECLRHWRTLSPEIKETFSYAEFAWDAADAMLQERSK